MNLFFKAIIIAFSSSVVFSETLMPFVSDGCSAFPDGTFQENKMWLSCCQKHDFSYWKGGTYKERLDADIQLELCVAKIGEPEIGLLMLAGVRVGGTPFLPTKFRWGYGWPYPKFYGELSDKEKIEVERAINQPQMSSENSLINNE